MYNRIYKFFSDNNLIKPLKCSFRQKYSIVHVLISLTESIKKTLGDRNIGCGIFVGLQKALILLNMTFFYQSLNITVRVVLLMNGLYLIYQMENNKFQSMFMVLTVMKVCVFCPLLIYFNYLNQPFKIC